jgi:hypothetical protein
MKLILVFLLVVMISLSGCINSNGNAVNNQKSYEISANTNIEKLEVFHFHGYQQCTSCINVGKCAEETVNKYFKNEQESGMIVFSHINGEMPENAELVRKYGAMGSSLWIGKYMKNGTFSKEVNMNVWYKASDMEKCKEYMKEVIAGKLEG